MSSHTFSIEADGVESIWDVGDLWRAAAPLQVLTLFVGGFEEARSVQDWLNHPADNEDDMRRILQADLSYPIILHPSWSVMDGYHRLGRCLLLNRPTIQVVRFLPDNLPPPNLVRSTLAIVPD